MSEIHKDFNTEQTHIKLKKDAVRLKDEMDRQIAKPINEGIDTALKNIETDVQEIQKLESKLSEKHSEEATKLKAKYKLALLNLYHQAFGGLDVKSSDDPRNLQKIDHWAKQVDKLGDQAQTDLQNVLKETLTPAQQQEVLLLTATDLGPAVTEIRAKWGQEVQLQGLTDADIKTSLVIYLARDGKQGKTIVKEQYLKDFAPKFKATNLTSLQAEVEKGMGNQFMKGIPEGAMGNNDMEAARLEMIYDALTNNTALPANPQAMKEATDKVNARLEGITETSIQQLSVDYADFREFVDQDLASRIGLKHTINQIQDFLRGEFDTPEAKQALVKDLLERAGVTQGKQAEVGKKLYDFLTKAGTNLSNSETQRVQESEETRMLLNGLLSILSTGISLGLAAAGIPIAFTNGVITAEQQRTSAYGVEGNDRDMMARYIALDKLPNAPKEIKDAANTYLDYQKVLMNAELLGAANQLPIKAPVNRDSVLAAFKGSQNPEIQSLVTTLESYVVMPEYTQNNFTESEVQQALKKYKEALATTPKDKLVPSSMIFANYLPQFRMATMRHNISASMVELQHASVASQTPIDQAQVKHLEALKTALAKEGTEINTMMQQRAEARQAEIRSLTQHEEKNIPGLIKQFGEMELHNLGITQEGLLTEAQLQNLQKYLSTPDAFKAGDKLSTRQFQELRQQVGSYVVETQMGLKDGVSLIKEQADALKFWDLPASPQNIDWNTVPVERLNGELLVSYLEAQIALLEGKPASEQEQAIKELFKRTGIIAKAKDAEEKKDKEPIQLEGTSEFFTGPLARALYYNENMPATLDNLKNMTASYKQHMEHARRFAVHDAQMAGHKLKELEYKKQEITYFQDLAKQMEAMNDISMSGPEKEQFLNPLQDIMRVAVGAQQMLEAKQGQFQTLAEGAQLQGGLDKHQQVAYAQLQELLPVLKARMTTMYQDYTNLMEFKVTDPKKYEELAKKMGKNLQEIGLSKNGLAQQVESLLGSLSARTVVDEEGNNLFTSTGQEAIDQVTRGLTMEQAQKNYNEISFALKNEEIADKLRKGNASFFDLPEQIDANNKPNPVLVAKIAQLHLNAVRENLSRLVGTVTFKEQPADIQAKVLYLTRDVLDTTDMIAAVRSGSLDEYVRLRSMLETFRSIGIDGTGAESREGGKTPKKLGAIDSLIAEDLIKRITHVTERYQMSADDAAHMDSIVKNGRVSVLLDTVSGRVIESDASLNQALQERALELRKHIGNIENLFAASGLAVPALTMERFGYDPKRPFRNMDPSKPGYLVNEAKAMYTQLSSLGQMLYGEQFGKGKVDTSNRTALINNLKKMNPAAVDYASRNRNSFSLFKSVMPGNPKTIGGMENTHEVSSAYNMLIASLPFSTDRANDKVPFLQKTKEFFRKNGFGNYSESQILSMFSDAQTFASHDEMVKMFNEYLGMNNTSYKSLNSGYRPGGEVVSGGALYLKRGLFLKLPPRYYVIDGRLYQGDGAIAFKDNCLNPNPTVIHMKLTPTDREYPGTHKEQTPPNIKQQPVQSVKYADSGEIMTWHWTIIPPFPIPNPGVGQGGDTSKYMTGTGTSGGATTYR